MNCSGGRESLRGGIHLNHIDNVIVRFLFSEHINIAREQSGKWVEELFTFCSFVLFTLETLGLYSIVVYSLKSTTTICCFPIKVCSSPKVFIQRTFRVKPSVRGREESCQVALTHLTPVQLRRERRSDLESQGPVMIQ